jgi:AmmeMemoRadiSam system protein B
MSLRLPQQAGRFYSGSAAGLKREIEECFLHRLGTGKLPQTNDSSLDNLSVLVSPHAGYVYSGPIAAHGYYLAAESGRPDSVIVLGPNHTGMGSGISTMVNGLWRTPLGDVEIDSELARTIQQSSQLIDVDETAHRYEHSIEVQLPFLQYIYGPRLKFVPICMMMQDLVSSRDVGAAIAKSCVGHSVLIVASTDMTHYEPQAIAERNDGMLIEAMVRLDEASLQNMIETYGLSMCGYGPVSAALVAGKALGASKGLRLAYATSGDSTGDTSQVVGYCSLAVVER